MVPRNSVMRQHINVIHQVVITHLESIELPSMLPLSHFSHGLECTRKKLLCFFSS